MARKSYYTGCHCDKYRLVHPDKYLNPGTVDVEYKSDWERKVFIFCDLNPFVIKWGYEPFAISYYSPVQQKQSIYKPDVYVECQYDDGKRERWLIEIKPVTYSVVHKAPKAPGDGATAKQIANYQKRELAYRRKSMDVATNFAKWEAAEQWCKNHGVNWLVLNESNTLGLFKSGQGV
jgi:hypothetical protein